MPRRTRKGAFFQQDMQGKAIPTLSWAEDASFQFCFDGIEPGGTVSVSTIGVKRDKESIASYLSPILPTKSSIMETRKGRWEI